MSGEGEPFPPTTGLDIGAHRLARRAAADLQNDRRAAACFSNRKGQVAGARPDRVKARVRWRADRFPGVAAIARAVCRAKRG